jgi:hypothetical protein
MLTASTRFSSRRAESSSPVPDTVGAGVVVAPALVPYYYQDGLGRPRYGSGHFWSSSARAAPIKRKHLCARAPEESISTARMVHGTSAVLAAVPN